MRLNGGADGFGFADRAIITPQAFSGLEFLGQDSVGESLKSSESETGEKGSQKLKSFQAITFIR